MADNHLISKNEGKAITGNNYINSDLSKVILFLGVSMTTKGGMTAVLVSYKKYIEDMQFIPTWRLGSKLVKYLYTIQAIVRISCKLLFNRNIKIVHIHGAANASFERSRIFLKIAKRFGKKVILHEHAADFVEYYNNSTNKQAITDTLNQYDSLIVLSKSWKEYYASIGMDEGKIHVLNNIVSPPEFRDIPRKDDKLHFMYMGEISNRKGAFDLLKAVVDHKDEFKDKLLLRMGGNVVDGDIKAYIKENGLQDFVSYEGWIAGEKKIECLNWEDVYILPSYNEGLPIAILEAMAYLHPIISTPVGGIPEIITSHEDGLLVTPGNSEEIANAIKYYIDNKDAIKIHGEKGYKVVQAFFPESVFKELTCIYNGLLKG